MFSLKFTSICRKIILKLALRSYEHTLCIYEALNAPKTHVGVLARLKAQNLPFSAENSRIFDFQKKITIFPYLTSHNFCPKFKFFCLHLKKNMIVSWKLTRYSFYRPCITLELKVKLDPQRKYRQNCYRSCQITFPPPQSDWGVVGTFTFF